MRNELTNLKTTYRVLLLYLLTLLATSLRAQTAWQLLHPLPTPYGLAGVNYDSGQFVAVGYFGAMLTSPDAVSWTPQFAESDGDLEDVAYGNGRFVAVGVPEALGADQPPYPYSAPTSAVLTSTDGMSWKVGASPDGFLLWRLVFANDLFVAFGAYLDEFSGELLPAIFTSPDGIVWTERWRGNVTDAWGALGGDPAVAVGNGAIVVNLVSGVGFGLSQGFLVTTNNLNWVEVTTDLGVNGGTFLNFGVGKFVAVGLESTNSDLKALLSADGFAWEGLTVRTNWDGEVQALGFGNGTFVILASVPSLDANGNGINSPIALISSDGRGWAEHSLSGPEFGNSGPEFGNRKLFYSQNTFVMVGQPQRGQGPFNAFAKIVTSPDGINWTRRFGATNSFLVGAAASDQGVVAIGTSFEQGQDSAWFLPMVGDSAVLLASTDGTQWRQTQRLAGQNLSSIVYGSGLFVAAGDTGMVTSPDGANWTTQTNAGTGWSRLRYGMGKFLALGGEADTNGSVHSKFGTSSNGLVWTIYPLENISSPVDAATDGQNLVLTASGGGGQPSVIWRSSDGSNWAQVYRRDSNAYPLLVAFGNGRFVAVETYLIANVDAVLISTDGTNWTKQGSFTEDGITDLIFAHGSFYATDSTTSQVFSSSDGVQWRAYPTGFHQDLSSLAAGRQGLFAIGTGGQLLHSPWDLVLGAPGRGLKGSFLIQVNGPPGANVRLQRGSMLNDWADWQTLTLGDSPTQVEDTDVTGSSQRFYRAVLLP